jgi:hypothetical protein
MCKVMKVLEKVASIHFNNNIPRRGRKMRPYPIGVKITSH